jgi:Lar family restriction alleviation protein
LDAASACTGSTLMPDELKPCPFCGGEAFSMMDDQSNDVIVCATCWAKTDGKDTQDQVIAAWNRRTP